MNSDTATSLGFQLRQTRNKLYRQACIPLEDLNLGHLLGNVARAGVEETSVVPEVVHYFITVVRLQRLSPPIPARNI